MSGLLLERVLHVPEHRMIESTRAARTASARGFTLVELMVVVVIVGILGTIGVASFRKRVFGSKSTEAFSMIQSIRAAEERYRAENLRYLDVSTSWFPAAPVARSAQQHAFYPTAHTDLARWRLLNPTVTGPVDFGYKVNAGMPSEQMVEPDIKPSGWSSWPKPQTTQAYDKATNGEHWFVIQAKADANGDGVPAYFLASSLRGDVYSQNEGE